jgi:hypothetical protein
VQARRDGKHIRYSLGDERVLDAVAALRAIAQAHLGAVGDLVASYLMGRDALEPVPAADLLERVRDGPVTVLDVRPPEEYAQGYVAGALNDPPGSPAGKVQGVANRPGDGRLLPRPLVCAVLRGRRPAAGGRIRGPAPTGWAAGVATGRTAGGTLSKDPLATAAGHLAGRVRPSSARRPVRRMPPTREARRRWQYRMGRTHRG